MKLKENVIISENGFIFDSNTGISYSVNVIGREMLQMLNEGKTGEQIRKAITEKYEVDEFVAEKDYYDFLSLSTQYEIVEEE